MPSSSSSSVAEIATPLTSGHVDVLIMGAGISGIGAGYHVKTRLPHKTFAILEAREAIGGTWDLFRYPGIRSDSDLHTFGYEFKPWTSENAIAPAEEILNYLRETVEENARAAHPLRAQDPERRLVLARRRLDGARRACRNG